MVLYYTDLDHQTKDEPTMDEISNKIDSLQSDVRMLLPLESDTAFNKGNLFDV